MIYDMASYRRPKINPSKTAFTEMQSVGSTVEFNSFQFLKQLMNTHDEYKRLNEEQKSLFIRIKNILYKVNPDLFDRFFWYEVEQSRISLTVAYERGLMDGQKGNTQAY